MNTKWTIFCDLDGVLADFDKGVVSVTGNLPENQKIKDMWKALAAHPDFYYSLDFMPDAKKLWSYIAPLQPIILSGLPLGSWAAGQKKRWVGARLGWDVPAVLGMARDKPENAMKYIGASDLTDCVLIDDREKARGPWENHGGAFILHTSAENSIRQLKGVLENESN